MSDQDQHWSTWNPERQEAYAAEIRERYGDAMNAPEDLRWCWLTSDQRDDLAAGHRMLAEIGASDDVELKARVSALLREEAVLPGEGATDSAWLRAQLDAFGKVGRRRVGVATAAPTAPTRTAVPSRGVNDVLMPLSGFTASTAIERLARSSLRRQPRRLAGREAGES